MRKKHGFDPLGAADGLVKSAIFGFNSARLYGHELSAMVEPLPEDRFDAIRREYEVAGGFRDNAYYGYVARTR